MTTLMAVDTPYLYFRAFFGVPKRFTTPEGHPVNAVRGVCDFLTRLLTDHSPGLVACARDDDWRPGWRVDLVPSYKAHRVAADGSQEVEDDLARQVPWVWAALEAAGLPHVGAAHHEADDVLASLVRRHDGPRLVVTGDKDLFQLVDDRTHVIWVGRSVAKHTLMTPELLLEQVGVSGDRYCDYAVLRGDPSDGLPGVRGIGAKTAASLVAQYPSLPAMLAAASDPDTTMPPAVRRALLGAADYLTPARKVVTAVGVLPLQAPTPSAPDPDVIERLTERLGLGRSLRRLGEAVVAVQQVER